MIIVEKEFFNGRVFMGNQTTFTSCVTTQCINKNLLYMETDCQTDKDIEVSCSKYRTRQEGNTIKVFHIDLR